MEKSWNYIYKICVVVLVVIYKDIIHTFQDFNLITYNEKDLRS